PPTTALYPLSLHDALPIYALVTNNIIRDSRLSCVKRKHNWTEFPGFRESLAGFTGYRQRTVCRGRIETLPPGHEPSLIRSGHERDRKSTRLNSSHVAISYA